MEPPLTDRDRIELNPFDVSWALYDYIAFAGAPLTGSSDRQIGNLGLELLLYFGVALLGVFFVTRLRRPHFLETFIKSFAIPTAAIVVLQYGSPHYLTWTSTPPAQGFRLFPITMTLGGPTPDAIDKLSLIYWIYVLLTTALYLTFPVAVIVAASVLDPKGGWRAKLLQLLSVFLSYLFSVGLVMFFFVFALGGLVPPYHQTNGLLMIAPFVVLCFAIGGIMREARAVRSARAIALAVAASIAQPPTLGRDLHSIPRPPTLGPDLDLPPQERRASDWKFSIDLEGLGEDAGVLGGVRLFQFRSDEQRVVGYVAYGGLGLRVRRQFDPASEEERVFLEDIENIARPSVNIGEHLQIALRRLSYAVDTRLVANEPFSLAELNAASGAVWSASLRYGAGLSWQRASARKGRKLLFKSRKLSMDLGKAGAEFSPLVHGRWVFLKAVDADI